MILDLATAGLILYYARIAVDQDFSLELFWSGSRHSGFFYKALDRFCTDTLGCILLKEIDDLFDISWVLHKIVLGFALFFFGKLWRTPGSFFVIESGKMMCFPSIKPIVDSNTVHRENGHQCGGIYALRAQ